ncbi:MAG: hypothetical protein JO131_04795 [Gammaproteobacteria bacterium]|nr:hypothetical protein [Gammaproteobacteria bacterium]
MRIRKKNLITFFISMAFVSSAFSQSLSNIKIKTSYYTSNHNTSLYCDATLQVSQICNKHTNCQVQANNNLCGDPEFGYTKTLITTYSCGSNGYVNKTQEGEVATLSCS